MGRPALKIDDEFCAKAESLSAQGLTMEQIADCLGIAAGTLYGKQAKHDELHEAIKSGRAKGIATITNALFVSAKGGNLGAQCFYLKNRAGWADKFEHTGADGGAILSKLQVEFIGSKGTVS